MTPEEFRRAMFGKRPSELFKEAMAPEPWHKDDAFEAALQYESPIKIIYGEMQTQFETDITKAVAKAVLPYDIQINKEELIKALQYDRHQYEKGYQDAKKACQKPEDEWVPIKFRPLTEEEKERYPEYTDRIYECRLPKDGEEVLITTSWGAVCIDIYHIDEELQSYFEDHEDADEVTAWKHLPKPYKPEEENDT